MQQPAAMAVGLDAVDRFAHDLRRCDVAESVVGAPDRQLLSDQEGFRLFRARQAGNAEEWRDRAAAKR